MLHPIATNCGQNLGMISGDIFDYQLDSSHNRLVSMWADDGRVGKPGAGWCPTDNALDPWFLVR